MDERAREEDPPVVVDAGREDRFHEKIQESRKIAKDYVAELEEKRNKICQDLGVSRATMEEVSTSCKIALCFHHQINTVVERRTSTANIDGTTSSAIINIHR